MDRGLHDLVCASLHYTAPHDQHSSQAVRAYTSFVRAYSKHQASFIFRLKDLDLIGVAKCFALLRLPNMPELRDVSRAEWEDAAVDVSAEADHTVVLADYLVQWSTFAYANVAREAKRIREESTKTVSSGQRRPVKKAAWSEQSDRKANKEKRREKNQRKKAWLKEQQQQADTDKRSREGSDSDTDGWEEYTRERRIAKKLKTGHSTTDLGVAFTEIG
jgi:ATP-dependent RNA helicase DDX55/SPB4